MTTRAPSPFAPPLGICQVKEAKTRTATITTIHFIFFISFSFLNAPLFSLLCKYEYMIIDL